MIVFVQNSGKGKTALEDQDSYGVSPSVGLRQKPHNDQFK